MLKNLRAIKSEAQALKNVMRANFMELRNGEGSLSAYSQRVKDAQNSLQKYQQAIDSIRESNKSLLADARNGTITDANRARLARNISTIERYKTRMTSLTRQIEQDNLAIQRLNTGVDSLRRTTEAITTVTKSYSQALSDQGKYYHAERTNIAGLRSQRESLRAQLHSEVTVTSQLRAEQEKLTQDYRHESTVLAERQAKLRESQRELARLDRTNPSGKEADQARKKVEQLTKDVEQSKRALNNYSESLSKNGKTLANQAQQATKVARSFREVDKASRGIGATRLGSAFRAGREHIARFNATLRESTADTRKWWSESKSAFAGVGIAIGGMAAGAAKAISSASQVQRRYIEVRNLLETSGESVSKSISMTNKMQQDGVKYSEQYGFAQKEIAEQYEELARRGYSSTAALGSMNAMLKASRASGDNLADVVKVTAQAVDAFGLRTENTTKMMRNSERVANAMASGADRTASGFQDMGVAMGYVSGSAKTVGWNVEQTSAAIGELSNRGLEGTRAGTGLRQVINSLIKPTKGATAALKEAGLGVDDLETKSGKLKSIDQVFQLINQHTKDMSKTDRGAFFKAVFGSTGQAAAQFLAESAGGLKANDDQLTKLIGHIKEDEKTDYIGRLSRKNMQSAQMQIERLKRTAEAFEVTIGSALLPAVNKVGNAIAKWAVSKEGTRTMKEFSTAAGNLANTVARHTKDIIAFGSGMVQGLKDGYHFIKPIVTGLGKIVDLFNHSSKGSQSTARNLGRMVGVFGTLAVGMKVAKTLFGGIFAISKDTVGSVSKFVTWIRGGTSAQKGLNAELEKTNLLLKESVKLQKEQYSGKNAVSGGSSSSGGDAVSDAADVISDIADSKSGKGEEAVAKTAEKAGEKASHFWQRGMLGKLGGFTKRFIAKLNPRNWTNTFASLGDRAGKGFHLHLLSHLKGLGGKIKSLFKPRSWTQTFANLGDKAAARFVKSSADGIHTRKGKIKFSVLFKGGSEAAKKYGGEAGMGWARRLTAKLGDARLSSKTKWSGLFSKGTEAAEESGAMGGAGFISKFAGKLSTGASILGDAWMVASAGIDIVKGIRTHNPKQRFESLGKGIGAVTGGALAGVFLGPEAAPIGAAIGSAIGGAMPKAIKWGKKIGGNIASGIQSSIRNIQKGGWGGVAKNWNDFWGGMGDWFDQTFGVDTGKKKSTRKRTKRPTISDRVIQTGVHVKRSDVANVKSMSKALRTYAGSLRRVKAELKKNDPSGELNKVNKFLRSHTKQWTAAAGPIKKIGDAFKYLSKFAASVAKKDAFAAFNRDLPKLDSTLKTHGKSIKKGINDITNALKGGNGKKGTTLLSRFKSLGKGISSVTSDFKNLNKHLNKTASDFRSIKKITDEFTGKKNPFKSMATGLDKLQKALKRDTKSIQTNVKKIKSAFEGKKGKNFAEIVKSASKPLKQMASDFRSMAKSTPKIAKGVKSMATNIKSLSRGKKGGVITKVAKEFDTLKSHLQKDYKSITSNTKKIASSLTGKKGFVSSVNKTESAVKKLRSVFNSLASNTSSFARNLKTSASAMRTLASKKSSLDSLSNSIKSLYRTVGTYKFGSRIASQSKVASRALSGKSSFSSRFKSASSSIKTTERSIVSTFNSLSKNVRSAFKSMWESVKQETNDSLDDIVDGINDAVDNINDAIDSMDDSGKGHKAKHAKSVHLATGTGPISVPTLGILNDGFDAPEINNSEAILHGDGLFELLSGRNIKRLLLPGDQVIKASDVSKLLGYRHFANGTTGGKKTNLVTVTTSSLSKIVSIANSILKSVRSISSSIAKIAKSVKSGNSDKVHDASYSRSSRSHSSRSKKSSSKPKYDLSVFGRNGFYGNLKATVENVLKTRSKDQIYLSQSTRRALGYKNAKGSTSAKASKDLIRRINRLYESRKRANEKIDAENRKKREAAKRREEKKQKNLKRELELTDEKYNNARKRAVLRKERAAERKKEREERRKEREKERAERRKDRQERERSRRRRSSGTTERRTSSGGYTYTYTSTARRRSSSGSRSVSSRSTRARVSVSVSGTSTLNRLLKKISGTHKLRVKVAQSGAKGVNSTLSSILKKVNAKKSKRSMLIHVSQKGAKSTSKALSKILKKVNSKRKTRTMLIHVEHDGVHDTKKELESVIDKVKDLEKGKKNDLTVHVKHDGVHETKKALESVADTGKKMWKDLDSYGRSGTRTMRNQFSSFSRTYRRGWSNLGTDIRHTMSHAWSKMRSDATHGLNGVIDVLNRGISRVNTVVHRFGGKNAVSQVRKLATGTGYLSGQRRPITKPTLAILNDGNDSPETGNKEVVWTPSQNRFDVVPGRNTPALLQPGQEVFNATESKHLGFTHFATGTGGLKALYEEAKKYWKSPVSTAKNMFDSVKGLVGTINEIAKGMHDRGEDQATDWWTQLWKMVEKKVNSDDVASGLLKAVEKMGRGAKYSQGRRMDDGYFDCSSLVSRALDKYFGKSWAVPHGWALTVRTLWPHAHKISRSEAKPGDPIFWLPDEHVGIYAGGDRYWSAFGPNAHPQVGMHSIAGSVSGVSPTFARFNDVKDENGGSKDPKVKVDNRLQRFIKPQVGKGFWKTIQKIADKYGDHDGLVGAFGLHGSESARARQLAEALKKADPRATHAGIAAIVGNAMWESAGLQPGIVNSIGAAGLWQFYRERRTALNEYARRHHMKWENAGTQIDFALNADSSRELFRQILEGHGSPYNLAWKFSHEWEVGGADDIHARKGEEAYKILGYANGGIATKPSIFGEAGPEMAIPLSTNKLDRSRELVAQALAVMSENSNSTAQGNLQNQVVMNNTVLNEMSKSLSQLTELVTQILTKPETISTSVTMDQRVIAQQVSTILRKDQTNRFYNTRMNRSNFK